MTFDTRLSEGLLVSASVLVLVVYHWHLWRTARKAPGRIAMGRHKLVRKAWVEMVQSGQHDVLAIQTLRNWIVSATFLASTSIIFALGLLGATFTTDTLSQFAHQLNFLGSRDAQLLLFKALALFVNFMAAFFNFSFAVRAFIHAGFALNLSKEQEARIAPGLAGAELETGALHFHLGMRGYYLAIPMTLWLFGPIWMLAGAVLMIAILRRID